MQYEKYRDNHQARQSINVPKSREQSHSHDAGHHRSTDAVATQSHKGSSPKGPSHVTSWNDQTSHATTILGHTTFVIVDFDGIYSASCHPTSSGVAHLMHKRTEQTNGLEQGSIPDDKECSDIDTILG